MIAVESANLYFLKPVAEIPSDYDLTNDYTPEEIEKYPDLLEEGYFIIGSKYVLNEVAVHMDDADIIACTGAYPDVCIIITSLSRARCKEITEKGKRIYAEKLLSRLPRD